MTHPGTELFSNLENAKRRAHLVKWRTMENLDKLLPEFEANFQRRGGKVIWANDVEEAQEALVTILRQAEARNASTARSQTLDEVRVPELLDRLGIGPVSAPTPAPDATPTAASVDKRDTDTNTNTVTITGVNFLIADTGSLLLVENEGNIRQDQVGAEIHVAVAGIDKVIPSLKDLDLFLPLLATHHSARPLAVYNHLINGPKHARERDGAREVYVILLDNGRTDLLAQPEQRQGLYCIRCEACLEVCPVHNQLGAHHWETVYDGPIGALISPHTQGMSGFKQLSEASTLCGKCTEVCPVRIDISRMLLLNRRNAVQGGHHTKIEKTIWKAFRTIMARRRRLDWLGGRSKNRIFRLLFGRKWGQKRALPPFSPKSFADQWTSVDPPQSRFP